MDKNADMAASMQSRQLTGNIVWGQKIIPNHGWTERWCLA